MFIPFQRICIANRGEIAVRIIRTCRRLGVRTHAIYSEADATALHVRLADSASLIGPGPVAESYLKIPAVLAAAKDAGCDAVHPGYGLLSESADFARACREHGFVFIGPNPDHIALMGHKSQARAAMAQRSFPLIPGSPGDLAEDEIETVAAAVGYPLIVKASRGGGGIGMAVVNGPEQLASAVRRARSLARRAFGDDALYLERKILGAHHIEVQILGDQQGAVRHLGLRDCSIQRRHQKVIEESPPPALDSTVAGEILAGTINAMQDLAYNNAGTVECLVAPDGEFYFLEMNTRLQVEHPVTELVTGLDLVEWQIRLAAGQPLDLPAQADAPNGHAIEARIYAEDPDTLLPAPGHISHLRLPEGEGMRFDAGVEAGDDVSQYYDPLIAKCIVWGPDRVSALNRIDQALAAVEIDGLTHNIPFLQRLVSDPDFRAARYDVNFVEKIRK